MITTMPPERQRPERQPDSLSLGFMERKNFALFHMPPRCLPIRIFAYQTRSFGGVFVAFRKFFSFLVLMITSCNWEHMFAGCTTSSSLVRFLLYITTQYNRTSHFCCLHIRFQFWWISSAGFVGRKLR